jgi:hypothetical protein
VGCGFDGPQASGKRLNRAAGKRTDARMEKLLEMRMTLP